MNDFSGHLPTLVRTGTGYRVHDPRLLDGTHYALDDHGDLVYTRVPAGATTAAVVFAALAAALWIGHNSLVWTGVAFAAALPVGFLLATALLTLVHVTTNPVRRYRRLTGRGAYAVEVADPESDDGLLCRRAERLAASPSWAAGRVDPRRRLAALLWYAVGEGDPAAVGELTALTEPVTDPGLQTA